MFLIPVCSCVCPPGSIFPSCKPSETIFKITFWLGYLNSCINPIIYPCFSQEFKKAFLNVLRGRCLRTASPPGHIATHSSSSGPASNTSDPSAQTSGSASSWCCCTSLSTSSPSAGGSAPARGPQIQSGSLLKAWCFSASRTPVPQNRSAKVLHLSLGVKGEAVWMSGRPCTLFLPWGKHPGTVSAVYPSEASECRARGKRLSSRTSRRKLGCLRALCNV